MTRLTAPDVSRWLVPCVFAALPTLGLVAGPSYAALIFGLGVVRAAAAALTERRLLDLDRELGLLALAFAGLCWASVTWSIDPAHSQRTAMQVTVIFAGALIFLAGPTPSREVADTLFRALLLASVAGAILLTVEFALGFPLQRLIMGPDRIQVMTKYNRGIDYLVILTWPQLGYAVIMRKARHAALLIAAVGVIVVLGASLAGKVGLLIGLAVLGVGLWRPRIVAPALALGMTAFIATVPWSLQVIAAQRHALAGHLKYSAIDRLAIWGHMSDRVMDRPLLGWGISAAGKTPASPDEAGQYRPAGTYPHDQWLQLWVETGVVGAALGLLFVLLILRRIRGLSAGTQPFAYSAFASAVAVASVNFEVTTDSWWAALCASAFLIIALNAMDRALRMTRS